MSLRLRYRPVTVTPLPWSTVGHRYHTVTLPLPTITHRYAPLPTVTHRYPPLPTVTITDRYSPFPTVTCNGEELSVMVTVGNKSILKKA